MATVAARSRAERNAAIAAAGFAQVASTCPWVRCDEAETSSTASSRQPSSRNTANTCPWADEAPSKPSRSSGTPQRNTCPWGSDANDVDSVRLADAARRRQRPSPKHYGAAGSGAPKLPSSLQEECTTVTERVDPAPMPCARQDPFPMSHTEPAPNLHSRDAPVVSANQTQPAPSLYNNGAEVVHGSNEDDSDEAEQREIIEQCLSEGLSEDQILEILEDWQNAKLAQHTRERMQSHSQSQQGIAELEVTGQPKMLGTPASPNSQASTLAATGTSLVASRQAKAKKSLSFGPTDEEIVDVLTDYSKENLTPPESPPNALSLAAMRKKVKEPSEASVGSFDSDKSRAAYFQSKSQMDAVKSKNRASAGIF